jgi:hypothetical protein
LGEEEKRGIGEREIWRRREEGNRRKGDFEKKRKEE